MYLWKRGVVINVLASLSGTAFTHFLEARLGTNRSGGLALEGVHEATLWRNIFQLTGIRNAEIDVQCHPNLDRLGFTAGPAFPGQKIY